MKRSVNTLILLPVITHNQAEQTPCQRRRCLLVSCILFLEKELPHISGYRKLMVVTDLVVSSLQTLVYSNICADRINSL